MSTAVKEFVEYFGGPAKAELKKSQTESNFKELALSNLFATLKKKEIRSGFEKLTIKNSKGDNVKAFSDDGQESEIDTFAMTKQGKGIEQHVDYIASQKSLELFVKFKEDVLALKYPETGQPVFDLKKAPQDFIDSAITPLVRERVIPDNFIEDALSDTYKLIQNSLTSWKGELKQNADAKSKKNAKIQTDFMGGRGKLDRAGAIGGKLDQLKGRVVEKVGKGNVQGLALTVSAAKMGKSYLDASLNLSRWEGDNPKNLESAKDMLNPNRVLDMKQEDGIKKYGEDGWEHIQKNLAGEKDPDNQRVILEDAKNMKKMGKLTNHLKQIPGMEDENGSPGIASNLYKFLATPTKSEIRDAKFYTMEGINLLLDNTDSGIGIAIGAKDIHKLRGALEEVRHDELSRQIAIETINEVEKAFCQAVSKINADAGDAIGGLFTNNVDEEKVEDFTAPETKGVKLIDEFAKGFENAFASVSPLLIDLGKSIATNFRQQLNGKGFSKEQLKDPKAAFAPFAAAATSATEAVSKELAEKFSDKKIIGEIALREIFPDEDSEVQMLKEMAEGDEEIRQLERNLVTIDQGGLSIAQQQSIEVLIAKIEKDRQVIKLVNVIGGSLQGLGSGPMSIVGYATEQVADEIVGAVLGPLKAAKLIIKLATNIKQSVERISLFLKFKSDVKSSKIAVSSLTSTIQGFLDNKKEQIAFREVENALLLIQIASEVVGSVPTPITIAVGKTMSKVAAALQATADFIESVYDANMLNKAWETTLQAVRDPGNRQLGLKALRINPTLGMHAIAWAGMVKLPPDPIARKFLDSTGLDENTLAVSGTAEKVREYLATKLSEDRKLNDMDELTFKSDIKLDWAPPQSLTLKCWALLTARASRDASPRLSLGNGEKIVLQAFKTVDRHKRDKELSEADPEELALYIQQAQVVRDALRNYKPLQEGNRDEHEEMANEVAGLISLAHAYVVKLQRLRGERLGIVETYKALEEVLVKRKLEVEVNKTLELSDEQFAEFFLCQISYNQSVIGIANDIIDEKRTQANEAGVKELYDKVTKLLVRISSRSDQENTKLLLNDKSQTLTEHLGKVATSEEFEKVAQSENSLNSLQLDGNLAVALCKDWSLAKSSLSKVEPVEPLETAKTEEEWATDLRNQAYKVSPNKAVCERIFEIIILDLFPN